MNNHHYMIEPFQVLPKPGRGYIPFHLQGFPIPDPLQRHFSYAQDKVVSSAYNQSNQLAYGRFLGTDWTQKNQPHFLGANERIVFEDSW